MDYTRDVGTFIGICRKGQTWAFTLLAPLTNCECRIFSDAVLCCRCQPVSMILSHDHLTSYLLLFCEKKNNECNFVIRKIKMFKRSLSFMPLNIYVFITILVCTRVYSKKLKARLFTRYCDLLTQSLVIFTFFIVCLWQHYESIL